MPSARANHRPYLSHAPRAAFPAATAVPEWQLMVDETDGGIYWSDGTAWVPLTGAGWDPVQVSPATHEPTTRTAWPSFLLLTSALNAEPAAIDLSPGGVATGALVYAKVWMHAGTYKGMARMTRGTAYGIADFLLNGTSLGTYDAYFASATYSGAFLPNAVVVTTTGYQTVTISKTGTKNATSTDHYAGFLSLDLRRTA